MRERSASVEHKKVEADWRHRAGVTCKREEGFLDHSERGSTGEGDWGNRLKFPPGYRRRVTVPHLRGKLFGAGSQRIIQQSGAGFGEFGLLSPRSCLGRHVVGNHPLRRESPWRGLWFGSRLLLTSILWFELRDPKVPSSHCSHIRRMSLEERLLLGLPHRSRRRTGFGNQEAAGPGLIGCLRYVRSELWVVKTSCRLGVSGWRGHSIIKRVVQGWIASGATRCCPGGGEAGAYRADLEGGVNWSLVRNLTF